MTDGFFFASGGSKITTSEIPSSTFNSAALGSTISGVNVITADGNNTLVDLSTITEFNAGFFNAQAGAEAQNVKATDGAIIDLSGVTTIVKSTSRGDRINFVVEGENSEIDLSSLQTIEGNGKARFSVTDGSLTFGDFTNEEQITINGSGQVNVNGNYTQGETGTLNIQLSGTNPGEFGTVAIAGTATLGGTLNVTLAEGYVPQPGDRFEIITAGSITGDFVTVTPGFDIQKTATGLILTVQ